MSKRFVNVVEVMADEDEEEAFDQPCKHENRVGGHATYCHHPEPSFGGGKCPYRFCDAAWHAKCTYFEANPDFEPARFPWFHAESPIGKGASND